MELVYFHSPRFKPWAMMKLPKNQRNGFNHFNKSQIKLPIEEMIAIFDKLSINSTEDDKKFYRWYHYFLLHI